MVFLYTPPDIPGIILVCQGISPDVMLDSRLNVMISAAVVSLLAASI